MRNIYTKTISFFCSFILLLTVLGTSVETSAEVIWEKTYYSTPLDYYAGSARTISVTDASFADWNGTDMVRIDSAEHPENWQDSYYNMDFSYEYALAWDSVNLYLYVKIAEEMTSLDMVSAARFYFDITPGTIDYTGFVNFIYNSTTGGIYVDRAQRFKKVNDAVFASSIGIHSLNQDGYTTFEASIPWSKMNEVFSPVSGTSIRYCLYTRTLTSGTYLYAQSSSSWTISTQPWNYAVHYLPMYFSDGEASFGEINPSPLTVSPILTSSFKEVNCALGKACTGTAGSNASWPNSNGTLLTEGSFQDLNTINGLYMEGFGSSDLESDGTITKIIDLGSSSNGLYKFEIGAAQVLSENILFPEQIRIYASANGFHYQLLGIAENIPENTTAYESSSESGTLKEMQKYYLTLAEGVNARYIKIKIVPPSESYDIVAVSEITAIFNTPIDESAEIIPILSLGAKINQEFKGIRFGAKFSKDAAKEVKQLGMILYPTEKLGSNTLNMAYYSLNPYSATNPSGVICINAVAISKSDYVFGKSFENYNTFTFFATILDIPLSQFSTNITAVPFVQYQDESIVYGTPLVRNYNAVLAATDAVME